MSSLGAVQLDYWRNSAGTLMDHRDRLILALSALLLAGRDTRHALETCISHGLLAPETLHALVRDPVAVITRGDVNYAGDYAGIFSGLESHCASSA